VGSVSSDERNSRKGAFFAVGAKSICAEKPSERRA
jgi:hypothetical protein